jgi:hypothetical protein
MPTFTIDEDAPILVEWTPRPGVQQVSRDRIEDTAERAAKAIDSAMNTIHGMARRVRETVDALTNPPSQVEVEFGLKLDAEAGAFIARAGVEAAINVKLTWEKAK